MSLDQTADLSNDQNRPAKWAGQIVVPVLATFAVSLALCWPMVAQVWATGDFGDTDDAMRMVQVRSWLAGQGWYDLTAWRLDPPAGSLMHWSRLVDLPIAALIKWFSLGLPPEAAERAARIAYPLVLQLALLSVMALIGRVLGGARGATCGAVLVLLSGFMLGQFVPGRVDHHSMQILLLVSATGSLLAALDPARARMAVLAGVCMALSLAVSLENLPFFAAAGAILPVAWALSGSSQANALRWFGLGLGGALVGAFGVFVPPSQWSVRACDAFSLVSLVPALTGALACAVLALATPKLTSTKARLGLLAVTGVVTLLPMALAHPECRDPFFGLDPLVRDLWLTNTTEARTLSQVLAIHPSAWPVLVLPSLLGLAGLMAAAFLTRGLERARWLALIPVVLAGMATASWIIRAESSLAPIAVLGGLSPALWIWRRFEARSAPLGLGLALAACLPFTGIGWALMAPIDDNLIEGQRLARAAACRQASAYAPLSAIPAGLIFAPMDAGSHLLAHTPHAVLGAPYHRNNRGNRLVIDAFLARPGEARALVTGSGATYLAICPGQVQLEATSARAPEGLAARLLAGEVPDWLAPVALAGEQYHLFRVLR